jgi:type II secretory pathway component PulF
MAWYHYRAYDAAGHAVSGALEAESLLTLESRLRAGGVWLLDAAEQAAVAPTGRRRLGAKRGELLAFFVQMSLLLRAGVTLPQALNRLEEDFRGSRMGQLLAQLGENVTNGVPLHQAMAACPRVFSPQVVAIVRGGELSGKLPDVFESLSAYYEWLDQLISDIRQALIYPLLVMGASLALVLLLFTLVVPRFVELLHGLSLQVPLLTRIVTAISNLLVQGWPVILLLAVGLPIAFRLALRSPRFACAVDRGLMRLPVFGPLIAMFALSRFTHNLAMLYRSGVPLLRGLEICQELVGNRAIAAALAEVRRGVAEGTPLSRCLSRHPFFPPALITMIATGESTGSLGSSLESVSTFYNKLIPRRIKIVFAIFDPLIMLALIGVVGCVALAVVLPILQLWQAR